MLYAFLNILYIYIYIYITYKYIYIYIHIYTYIYIYYICEGTLNKQFHISTTRFSSILSCLYYLMSSLFYINQFVHNLHKLWPSELHIFSLRNNCSSSSVSSCLSFSLEICKTLLYATRLIFA